MNRLSASCVAAALSLAPAMPASAWSGPQVSLVNKNGRKVIQICDQGGACQTSTPFFLNLNTQTQAVANRGDWSTFLYEARLQLSHLPPETGIVPILQVDLLSTSDSSLVQLASELNQLNPRPYLFPHYYLEAPANSFEAMTMQNVQGQVVPDTGSTHPFSLSTAWIQFQQSEIQRVLTRLDGLYPQRIVGVHIGYADGGEWFMRPLGWDGVKTMDEGTPGFCAPGAASCNIFPFVNDSATQPGPIGRQVFYLSDYSATTTAGFCAGTLLPLPTTLQASCRAATTLERNNAAPGQTGTALGRERGAFLDPADVNSLRSAYYNRFVSQETVAAITAVAATAKTLTSNFILTSSYYGYLNSLDHALPTSGHTAVTSLEASNSIDILAGPYSYGVARSLGNPFDSQGVGDSPKLHGKLWFDEDDTRTVFTEASAGFKTIPTTDTQAQAVWDSIRILRRNLLSAGLRGHGSWFVDLTGTGWYGTPSNPSDSDTLWANLWSPFVAVNKLQMSAPNRFNPQVAVFTDDLSANYVAGFTPAGDNTFGFATDVAVTLNDTLARLGTPYRNYLLSDLLSSNLDLSSVKLAILPNAWALPANIRSAVDSKLRTPGRTLLFVYAAGYINGDGAASVGNIGAFTGINTIVGSGTPGLNETFNVNGTAIAGGPAYPLTPWFSINDGTATQLATYSVAGGVSMARKTIAVAGGSYTSVLAAAPSLPLQMLRKISEDAGVFHFAPAGDIVEAAGNMMFLHAATDGFKTITFPQTMPRIFETAQYPSDTLMCSNCSSLASLPFNAGDTRAFRFTSPPIGNFELIAGTSTIQGWAADMDVPSQSLAVDFYINGPFGAGGTFFTEVTASTSRPDVATAFGISANHGFNQALPSCPHGSTLYAYALDPESNGDGSAFIGSHPCP
ncbi:MAG TPA: hypothetical protein VGH20_15130 [Myxococcales bacterium]